jgi:hypothetical protein
VINITFLIVAIPRIDTTGYQGSEGALFVGSSKKAKRLSIWLHLAINILATILFIARNSMQQVLTAPTRQEIDRAHNRRQLLDIGVWPFHNLKAISRKRASA